jgi:lambda family phage portal protein
MPDHAKILRETNGRIMRMYEAAVTNNLNSDFTVSITSANAEILTSISAARSRARKLERDNPYGRAILETFQDNVAGDEPFRLEMKVGKWVDNEFIEESETNRLIEAAWEEAGMPENCTVRRDMSRAEVDWQAITALVRDGGILARHYRAFPNNPFNYAIEPIEVDRLDHFWARPQTGSGNEVQFSIEMDEYHAAIAYHLLTKHPGDVFAWSASAKYRERVPAENIIALFDIRTRAGQYVGMPRFASIIQRLHRIDQFDIAHVTAAIWASCKPFFITQEFPTAMEYVPDFIKTAMQNAMAGDAEGEGDKIANVEPGTGEILAYGQKPVLVDPKFPVEAAVGFKKDNLRAAAAGSGAAYHMIANDLENVNFSSGRLGLQQFQDTCKKLQRHFIVNYRRPHFNVWLKYAILSGELPIELLPRLKELQKAAKFFGRRWPYVNPLQDAQADILRVNAGLTSRGRVIAESDRGGDVEEVDAEIASDRKIDESHDLDFTNPEATKPGDEGEDGADPPPRKGGKQTIRKTNGNGHMSMRDVAGLG